MTEDDLKQALLDVWHSLIPNGDNGDAVVGWDAYTKLEDVIRRIAPEELDKGLGR